MPGLDDGFKVLAVAVGGKPGVFLIPRPLRRLDLAAVAADVAPGRQRRMGQLQGGFSVANDHGSVHLTRVKGGNIDGNKPCAAVQLLGASGKVGQPGTDGNDQIRRPCNGVCRQIAGDAHAAQIHRMGGAAGALPRLRFRKGDLKGFTEFFQRRTGFGIADAAAADNHGPLACRNGLHQIVQVLPAGSRAADAVDAFFKEIVGEIVALPLRVLGKRHADRPGLSRVCQNPECLRKGGHQLLRAGDSIPEFAHGTQCVVGGDAGAVFLLKLLQYRVWLTHRKGIAGEKQQRNAVDGGAGSGGDHIGRAGADGGGAGDDPPAVVLPGKAGGRVGHALLIPTLINTQVAGVFVQRLPQAHHNSVAEDGEHAVHKFGFYAVQLYILIIQEFHNGLAHSHDAH